MQSDAEELDGWDTKRSDRVPHTDSFNRRDAFPSQAPVSQIIEVGGIACFISWPIEWQSIRAELGLELEVILVFPVFEYGVEGTKTVASK